jgi:hypothetical protein
VECLRVSPYEGEINKAVRVATKAALAQDALTRARVIAEIMALPAVTSVPVAWVVRIKKTHEFCDPTELYGDTAEEVVEISSAWNSEYSEPEPLYTHPAPAMTAELIDEVLEALKIGLDAHGFRYASFTAEQFPPMEVERSKLKEAIEKLTVMDSLIASQKMDMA